ncbi:hypothetical protein, partial [Rhodanobacter lindaniclasticus]
MGAAWVLFGGFRHESGDTPQDAHGGKAETTAPSADECWIMFSRSFSCGWASQGMDIGMAF